MNFRLASLDSINLSFMSSQRSRMMIGSSPEDDGVLGWSDSRLLWSVRSRSHWGPSPSAQFLSPSAQCQPSLHCLATIRKPGFGVCYNIMMRSASIFDFCILSTKTISYFVFVDITGRAFLNLFEISAELLTKPLTHELRSVPDKNFLWHFIQIHRFNSYSVAEWALQKMNVRVCLDCCSSHLGESKII